VLAEALSPNGTERGFAEFMTQRAQQLGMTNSVFKNSSGWPEAGHRMSMRDLALLARRLIEDFPEYYPMFAETEFQFDGRAPQNTRNRNPVLTLGIGADGLKTGHTQEAGFGLTGSAQQGERRIIWVISGLDTAEERARESEAIVNWAFRQFTQKELIKAGTEIARAEVWMGAAETVGLTIEQDFATLIPTLSTSDLKAELIYEGPLRAPVLRGDRVGELVFKPEGLPETRVPLVASEDVITGGFMPRLKTVTGLLLSRLQQGPEGAL
jgi:D-alanyl-D-alanine carboxypeptidase (penicillin-binding protein 5/6)